MELQAPERAGLTHLSASLPALLDQLQDFRLPEHMPQASEVALPPYVPQVEPNSPLLDEMPRTTALTLSEFISPMGKSYVQGINKARAIRQQGASTIALVGTSTDPQLEAVWRKPHAFVEALREASVDIVFGPAFSVYLGRLPLERHANRSRNIHLYSSVCEADIQVVPAAGFVDAFDADFVGKWVAAYGLKSLFVDLQSADTPAQWNLVRETLPALVASGTTLNRIVINGVAKPTRVIELAHLTDPLDLVLTNGAAFQLARSGHDYSKRGEDFTKQKSEADRARLFTNLAGFYGDVAARRSESYIPLSLQPALPLASR